MILLILGSDLILSNLLLLIDTLIGEICGVDKLPIASNVLSAAFMFSFVSNVGI